MQRRRIPGTDLDVSVLGLGGWLTLGDRLDEPQSLRLLGDAVDAGINFLDLADVYGNGGAERVVGKFLRQCGRQRLVVTSKVFWPTSDRPEDRGLSRRHVHAAIDRSLERLGIDCIDVYFCHREDPSVPLAETVQAMGDLVAAGKIRAWGTSCWQASTLLTAHRLAGELGVPPPRLEQPPYNLFERSIERGVVPCCRDLAMGVVAFSPLAGGVLTGKYVTQAPPGSRGRDSDLNAPWLRPACRSAVARFVGACQGRGVLPAVAALAWVLQRPGVTAAITGATSPQQLAVNCAASSYDFGSTGPKWVEDCFPRWQTTPWRRWWRRLTSSRG